MSIPSKIVLQLGAKVTFLRRPFQVGLACSILVALASLMLPNHYRSMAQLLPMEAKTGFQGPGSLATTAAALGVNIPGQEGGDASFIEILNSRPLRESVVSQTYVFHYRTWRFGSQKTWNGTLYDFLKAKNMDRAVLALAPFVSASRDTKTRVLTVTVETISAELSHQVVERMLALLENFAQQKGRTRGGAKALFAGERLKEARQELDFAEEGMRRFLDKNRNYQTSTDPFVRLQGARLEAELRLRNQLVTTLAINREQALMEEKNDQPILNILDPGSVPYEKSSPARAKFVLLSFLLASLGTLAWQHRQWIMDRFMVGDLATPDAGPDRG